MLLFTNTKYGWRTPPHHLVPSVFRHRHPHVRPTSWLTHGQPGKPSHVPTCCGRGGGILEPHLCRNAPQQQATLVFLPVCRQPTNHANRTTRTTPPFRTFLAKEFYIDTITLADEPGNDFLGFSINLNTRSIRYKPPDSPSQFLHPASASPTTMVIRSSLDSRKHLARRLAYPQREVQVALQQLRDLWNVTLSHTVLPGYAPTRLISFDKNACFRTFHCLTRHCLIRPPLQHSGLFSLHLRHGR